MTDSKWINTKDLIGTTFHVNDVAKRQFRMWDDSEGKYSFSDTPKKGYSPFWKLTLDDGDWSASGGQYSQLLLACEDGGMADVLGKTFSCESNGKSGMEIRYFFNLVTN